MGDEENRAWTLTSLAWRLSGDGTSGWWSAFLSEALSSLVLGPASNQDGLYLSSDALYLFVFVVEQPSCILERYEHAGLLFGNEVGDLYFKQVPAWDDHRLVVSAVVQRQSDFNLLRQDRKSVQWILELDTGNSSETPELSFFFLRRKFFSDWVIHKIG